MAIFNSFIFDDINSLDKGVYITGEAVYNAPERIIEMVEVPGRNGAIAIDQGRFANIEITYPAGAYAVTQEEWAGKIEAIRNILCSRYSYKRLEDTYNPEEYRMGLYKAGLEVAAVAYSRAGEFNITFDCKPQRWLKSGEEEQTFTGQAVIENPTDFEARPLLVVTGYGNLTIGERTFTIAEGPEGSSQMIHIDCESQEAWEVTGAGRTSRNDYIQNAGDEFPSLIAGENDIICGANISQVIITPRWWRI